MIVFPNCKINLGLNIIRKRSDGYHDLETVFYPLPLRDALEVIRYDDSKIAEHSKGLSGEGFHLSDLILSSSGISIKAEAQDHLCAKAFLLLKRSNKQVGPVRMHLHKTIPMGAGLGGGSSNGAFTLKLLNDKFNLQLTTEELLDLALQLGSDCPFFIINTPCFAAGRGEMLQHIQLDLSAYSFVLVHPGIHSSTANAFSNITPAIPARSVREVIQQPVETWKDVLVNDFEGPVSQQYPVIKEIKEKLYASGAIYASMTGSGSSLYGIFPKGEVPAKEFVSYNHHIMNG